MQSGDVKGRVLYDFEAQGANQLSLKCGSIIKVLIKGEPGGWSRGEDSTGNYLKFLKYVCDALLPVIKANLDIFQVIT